MAQIGGAIISAQGQVIPGALVTLRDPDGKEVVHDTSDEAGEWFIDNQYTEGSGYYIDITKNGYGQTLYPSNAAPAIISMEQLTSTPIPKWVWIVIAVLVVGGTVILLRNTFKNK